MKKFCAFLLFTMGLTASFLIGYFCMQVVLDSSLNKDTKNQVQKTLPPRQDTKSTNSSADPIKAKIDGMTLDEKLGQLVIAGIDGHSLNQNTINLIKDYKVGGFILYNNNISSADQLLSLINSLKETNSDNPVPLFISVDQEGGNVDRMPGGIKKFPSNQVIGQKNNSNLSYNIGNTLAFEIKSFGFNLNFAPVLDINSNPKNPVIGNRSFGSNAEVVSNLGVQTMKGIQSGDVIPVIKHFPGHGDTSVDSHKELPVINKDLNKLETSELIPFSNAIKNNADAVMIAHILLPQIDAKNPASLSETIVTDILRHNLNFKGVVITDDITMGAIIKNYNLDDAAVKAINAGNDIVLVAHDYNYEIKVFNALKKAVKDNQITEDRIDESVYRILKLKNKYNLNNNTISSVNISTINQKISSVLK